MVVKQKKVLYNELDIANDVFIYWMPEWRNR